MSIRVSLFPEPTVRKGYTRKGRHVAVFRDLLSGILLKRLHIGIIESARRILTGIEVAEQAVGLQILDMFIELPERYLCIRDPPPPRIPSTHHPDLHSSTSTTLP